MRCEWELLRIMLLLTATSTHHSCVCPVDVPLAWFLKQGPGVIVLGKVYPMRRLNYAVRHG